VYVVLGVVVGVVVTPFVAVPPDSSEEPEADGTVAVVPVEGSIDGETAASVTAALAQARNSEEVKAVVVVANSGGGGAAASERLYFGVRRTAEQMPVVGSVDAAAASGAYYTLAPADEIYVKPSSTVGSIGVLAQLPEQIEPNDIIGTTGPNKLSGSGEREFLYILESLQRAFVSAVLKHRSDELEIPRTQLERARIYSGGQAVRLGLADEIGDRTAAIARAAEAANLDEYRVRVLRPNNGSVRFLSRGTFLASDAPDKRVVSDDYLLGEEVNGPRFLMVSGLYLDATDRTISAHAVPDGVTRNATAPGSGDATPTPAGGSGDATPTPTSEPSDTTPTPASEPSDATPTPANQTAVTGGVLP
jgi:protease-4